MFAKLRCLSLGAYRSVSVYVHMLAKNTLRMVVCRLMLVLMWQCVFHYNMLYLVSDEVTSTQPIECVFSYLYFRISTRTCRHLEWVYSHSDTRPRRPRSLYKLHLTTWCLYSSIIHCFLQGSILSDCCTTGMCPLCVMCQLKRQYDLAQEWETTAKTTATGPCYV